MLKFFNPKVKFSMVAFRREKAQGRYIAEAEVFCIDYDKIDSFGDGVIKLDNGESVYVEQDHEQINILLENKLREAEAYNEAQRLISRTGLEPTDGESQEE